MTPTAPATSRYEIPGGDYERAGLASKSLKEQLKRIGAAAEVIRRVVIAAYEAETNAVIHGGGGTMTTVLDEHQVTVEVSDQGPGMADIDLAMTEGYSTAPAHAREMGFGAGLGLPNIRKNSDRFSIESIVGQGTRVFFTVRLRPIETAAVKPNSLHVVEGKCIQCLRCLHACPTRALRVRGGRPQKLDYLCVDCTRCMDACANGALSVAVSAAEPAGSADNVLVIPPAVLSQFLRGCSSQDVLAALGELGFSQVIVAHGAELALRAAALAHLKASAGSSTANLLPGGPVISSVCPAVVNLIEARFPSLIPQVLPHLSPLEAVREGLAGRKATFVVLCPAQGTLVGQGRGPAKVDTILPDALAAKLRPLLPKAPAGAAAAAGSPAAPADCDDARILRVTGIAHVVRVLEEIEDGQMAEPLVVELFACDEGCFGSPLLHEDPFLAQRRLRGCGNLPGPTKSILRASPLVGRAGLRLDENMATAIRKLGQIDRLLRDLPGRDCGLCGSPTCSTLAEDVLLGRAEFSECRYVTRRTIRRL